MKTNIIVGIIILIAAVIVTVLIILSAMTDPIPPHVRAGWYLPHQDIVWTTTGTDATPFTQERLILAGHLDISAPQFPPLSPYGRYENYTHLTTGDKYTIATWYFTEEGKFLGSQKNLLGFLETYGKTSSVELNFTEQIIRNKKTGTGIQHSQKRLTIPDRIKATGYESVNTSGYFFTVMISGEGALPVESDYARNKEYYIVYYGITIPANLTSQTPFLTDMIAETYRYDHLPSEAALATGAEKA